MNKFKELFYTISDLNDIPIYVIEDKQLIELYNKYGRSSAYGLYIINGAIYISDNNISYELALHELLHILVVPKEFRNYVHLDTVQSYKLIKTMYNDSARLLTESAVIGLQHIMYSNNDCIGSLYGTFFNGRIREQSLYDEEYYFTDVSHEWIDRGNIALSRIKV